MSGKQSLNVALPSELVELIRSKVAAGEYATESDVIGESLNALVARNSAVERWLIEEVGPAYDALKADPARALTADAVRAALQADQDKASGTE